jgi:Fe-S-cluster containining protein
MSSPPEPPPRESSDRVPLEPFLRNLEDHFRKTTAETLSRDPKPLQVGRIVESAFDAFGDAIEGLSERVPPPGPLACRQGCAHCCHQPVETDPLTVLNVADYIQRHFSSSARTLLAIRLLEREKALMDVPYFERMNRRMPCPLLVDGSCSIYPVRPLVCRSFNSTDAEACKRAIFEAGTLDDIPSWALPWDLGRLLDRALKEAADDSGRAGQTLELGSALKEALDTPNAAQRWLGGEKVFARPGERGSGKRR